nr:hypothetical protein [uncultured Rhodococcus sp.]
MRNPFNRRTRQAESTPDPTMTPPCASSLPQAELDRAHRFAVHFENRQPFTAPDTTDWQHWRDGKLVPWYITHTLDCGQHIGPQVDIACKAEEPAVDRWEAGVLYPTWEQAVALAELVGVRVRDLANPEAVPHHHDNRPLSRKEGTAILSFEPDAVREATSAHPEPPPDLT